MKILVVDDDATMRFLMSEILDMLGYEHDIVSSADQCIGLLVDAPRAYSMVLVDLHMPVCTGFDLTKQIRQLSHLFDRHLPVIAVTADNRCHLKSRLKRFGLDDVVAKPILMDNLQAVLSSYGPMTPASSPVS